MRLPMPACRVASAQALHPGETPALPGTVIGFAA